MFKLTSSIASRTYIDVHPLSLQKKKKMPSTPTIADEIRSKPQSQKPMTMHRSDNLKSAESAAVMLQKNGFEIRRGEEGRKMGR